MSTMITMTRKTTAMTRKTTVMISRTSNPTQPPSRSLSLSQQQKTTEHSCMRRPANLRELLVFIAQDIDGVVEDHIHLPLLLIYKAASR